MDMASCTDHLNGPHETVFFFCNIATNVCNNILNFITSAITFYNVRIFKFLIFQAYCLMPTHLESYLHLYMHSQTYSLHF